MKRAVGPSARFLVPAQHATNTCRKRSAAGCMGGFKDKSGELCNMNSATYESCREYKASDVDEDYYYVVRSACGQVCLCSHVRMTLLCVKYTTKCPLVENC